MCELTRFRNPTDVHLSSLVPAPPYQLFRQVPGVSAKTWFYGFTRGKKQSSETTTLHAWSRARFIENEAPGSALGQRRHRGTSNQAPSKRDRTWVQKRPGARRSPTRGPWSSGTRGGWWLGGLLLYTREMVRRRGPCVTLRNTPCWPSSFYMFLRGSGRRCRRNVGWVR